MTPFLHRSFTVYYKLFRMIFYNEVCLQSDGFSFQKKKKKKGFSYSNGCCGYALLCLKRAGGCFTLPKAYSGSALKEHIFLKAGIKDAVCWEYPYKHFIIDTVVQLQTCYSFSFLFQEIPVEPTHDRAKQDSHCLQPYRTRAPFFISSPLISAWVKGH